ncbi:MAG: hypothetical protein CMF62_00665 [Magnetococcales bacterium]|nr:hypothetical protein [Magnetococcales bacterium]|tara:strand:- start:24161 stop:24961 length:801 start_codon:yes stop_codon:yes gene_type:complete
MGFLFSKQKEKKETKEIIKPKELKRRALLIGINYENTENELYGCINDTTNLESFLISKKEFEKKDIIRITDHTETKPLCSNLLKEFDSLVTFANDNKDHNVKLFISFSGHGSFRKDSNYDEDDGYDEVICGTDGVITDDLIKARLIDRLDNNVELTILIDCCHSGTMCDLKYKYEKNTFLGDKLKNDTKCNVKMISGCRDNQESADAFLYFEYQGAMTSSFLKCYDKNKHLTTLLKDMRDYLKKNNFEQVPQLTCGKLLSDDATFF